MLLASRPARLAGRSHHVNHDRFIRFTRAVVIANADRQIKIEKCVISGGRINAASSKFLERLPVANCNIRVKQRNLCRRGERLFLLIRQLIADIGDHDVPTCEDTVRSLNRSQLTVAYIRNLDTFGAGCVTLMSYSHHCAVQTDTHRRVFLIQLGVVCACGNNVGRRTSRNRLRNQFAHQQPRDGGIAIGKMEKVSLRFLVGNGVPVHAFPRRRVEIHPLKPGSIESPRILRRHSIETDSEQRLRSGGQEFNDLFIHLDEFAQEILVAHARQPSLFLIGTQAGQVVFLVVVQSVVISFCFFGERRLSHEFLPFGRISL